MLLEMNAVEYPASANAAASVWPSTSCQRRNTRGGSLPVNAAAKDVGVAGAALQASSNTRACRAKASMLGEVRRA